MAGKKSIIILIFDKQLFLGMLFLMYSHLWDTTFPISNNGCSTFLCDLRLKIHGNVKSYKFCPNNEGFKINVYCQTFCFSPSIIFTKLLYNILMG